MRRHFLASLCLVPLVAFLGCCHHYAGVCDCEYGYGCRYNYGGPPIGTVTPLVPVPAAPAAQPEMIKEMPKAEVKPAPETPPPPPR